jgi:uncharacterized protein
MLKTLLLIACGVYALIGAAMYFGQRKLMYHPDSTHTEPSAEGLNNVAEHVLAAPDGEKVIAWYGKAQPGQPTILYFHGNAGSLASRSERIRKYLARGRGMFMMTYRGFAGSSGAPSEAANVADAKRAYDALLKEGVAPDDIIIYGESIGSGVAVQVAAEKKAAGLILDAPYTAMVDLASGQYPWLPVRLLLKDRYESRSYIASIKCPLLIIHGEKDSIIPVAMGRAMFALAAEPKEIVTFPEAGHADHYMFGSYEAINAWIDKVRLKQASTTK